MENQHEKIKGYRDLTQGEIDLMNEVKRKAEEVGELVRKLREYNQQHGLPGGRPLDQRWISIGATDLQTGFMALVRGIAQPTTF